MSDKCLWPNGCSNSKRCEAFGECVARFQNRHKKAYVNIEHLQSQLKTLQAERDVIAEQYRQLLIEISHSRIGTMGEFGSVYCDCKFSVDKINERLDFLAKHGEGK